MASATPFDKMDSSEKGESETTPLVEGGGSNSNGYNSKGGRGRGAPRMSMKDVVGLPIVKMYGREGDEEEARSLLSDSDDAEMTATTTRTSKETFSTCLGKSRQKKKTNTKSEDLR